MSTRTNGNSTVYGTALSENAIAHRSNGSVEHGETESLLGNKSRPLSLSARLNRHMKANVSTHRADLILLVCYVITGLLDSSSVVIWGSFVSMQTGNSIYLGQGLSHPTTSTRWARSLVSIAAFILGSFLFSRFHRLFSPPRCRWVLVASTTFQLLLIAIAAITVTLKLGDNNTDPNDELPFSIWVALPIALVAFQAAGQTVLSRVVKLNALTSTVLTSIYCDLAGDAKLFAGLSENVERNRRAAAPVFLVLGALAGGALAGSGVGMMGALWMAVVLKAGVVLAWLFWAQEKEES